MKSSLGDRLRAFFLGDAGWKLISLLIALALYAYIHRGG